MTNLLIVVINYFSTFRDFDISRFRQNAKKHAHACVYEKILVILQPIFIGVLCRIFEI